MRLMYWNERRFQTCIFSSNKTGHATDIRSSHEFFFFFFFFEKYRSLYQCKEISSSIDCRTDRNRYMTRVNFKKLYGNGVNVHHR